MGGRKHGAWSWAGGSHAVMCETQATRRTSARRPAIPETDDPLHSPGRAWLMVACENLGNLVEFSSK